MANESTEPPLATDETASRHGADSLLRPVGAPRPDWGRSTHLGAEEESSRESRKHRIFRGKMRSGPIGCGADSKTSAEAHSMVPDFFSILAMSPFRARAV